MTVFWETSAQILLQIGLISVFVTLFFFTYVDHVEHQIALTQVDRLVDRMSESFSIVLSDNQKQLIVKALKLSYENNPPPSPAALEENNLSLEFKAGIWTSALFVVLMIGVGAIVATQKLNLMNLALTSFISLAAVVMVEFLFLNVFARHYRSLDENYINEAVVDALIQYRDNHQSQKKDDPLGVFSFLH